jgi:Uma2 family endonuclease
MNANLKRRVWTQDEFFTWAELQNERYEFDGVQPIAMTGGTNASSIVEGNLITALNMRLRGHRCQPLGPNAGVETVAKTIRYPDALITCSEQEMTAKCVTGPVVVFEVVSPTSVHMDHVIKLGEYMAVDSIRRYVIIESTTPVVTVIERKAAGEPWGITRLTQGGTLYIPEVGIEISVAELYERVIFGDEANGVPSVAPG